MERRQAETLIQETQAQDALESNRRGQQELDNWHQSRSFRTKEKTREAKDSQLESPVARIAAFQDLIDPNET